MAGVKKTSTTKAKKSSKILDQNNNLSNDELLEQILNKKKNKTSKNSTTTKNKSTSTVSKQESSTTTKKKKEIKETISSDDLYEQIRAKRTIKKRLPSKKKEVSTKDDVSFSKAIREIEDENTDLIITREIRFDDLSSNLKNKKNIEELRKAIESFDKLDDFESKISREDDEIELLPFVRYSNYKLRKILIVVGFISLLVSLILGFSVGMSKGEEIASTYVKVESISNKKKEEKKKKEEEKRKREEEQRKQKYNECLSSVYSDMDNTDVLSTAVNNLETYIKEKYNASIVYEDINTGFVYGYNKDQVYYAASTIKSLGALYVYTKAVNDEINLDDTMVYSRKYDYSYSQGLDKVKYGTKVSIRDLVKYSVMYSDNSAHQMIVAYVGRSNLKEFGKSLGAKNTLNGGDNFGNISAEDGHIYMKALYNFFNNNGDLGKELEEFFLTSAQKEISVNNLEVANKYGMYKKYYHNIGIMYDKNPYIVSITTLEGLKDREKVINDISSKIFELHNTFYKNRESVCKVKIYGQ